MRAMVVLTAAVLLVGAGLLTACSRGFVAGAATAGAVGGGVYEYSNKKALDDLKEDYEDGKISKDEYERRKREIEKRSVVY